MAKKKDIIDIDDENSEDVLSRTERYKRKMKDQFHKKKEEFKIYSNKAKKNIQEKPFESVLIATGAGVLLGASMLAGIIGIQQKYHKNYMDKCSSSRINLKNWSNSFENDIKNKPLQSIGIALGTGLIIGLMSGKKKWE